MKVKNFIITIVLCLVLVGAGVGVYCAWPAIVATIRGNAYYSAEDVDKAYNDGFEAGNNNKDELTAQVDYYKGLVDEYYKSILDYQEQVKTAEKQKTTDEERINFLESSVSSLESTISSLREVQTQNEQLIDENNEKIANYEKQISDLRKNQTENAEEVKKLNARIDELNSLNSQLTQTNSLNVETIKTLNSQIVSLNEQIVNLTKQVQGNSDVVSALNAKIAELEKSVKYYEEYIAQLETGEQVVATFEFNGSVINVQILQKGSKVSVVDPVSTDYVIFNYWTVDGEQVDLADFTLQKNTKFVANITRKYDVKFMNDSSVVDSQIIAENEYAILPEEPSKDGWDFDYWTLDGSVMVDVENYNITQTTTFIAKFTQLFEVKFMFEADVKSTQQVRSGEYAVVDFECGDVYKVLNGWKVGGQSVTVSSYQIFANTIFNADIIYKYNVKFMNGDEQLKEEIIVAGSTPVLPQEPVKDGMKFKGWSIDKENVLDLSSYAIYEHTIFYAVFGVKNLSSYSWEELSVISDEISSQNLSNEVIHERYGFGIGDERTFSIQEDGDWVEYTVIILGFNHDDLSDGSGKAGITFGMKNLLATTYKMNSLLSNVGGWDKSEMRTNTMAMLLSQLPADLQKIIKAVNKKTTNGDGSSSSFGTTIVTSSDKLWLCALGEIVSPTAIENSGAKSVKSNAAALISEGSQYDYYKNLIGDADPFSTAQSALIKNLSNGTGSANGWFLRSANFTNIYVFYYIYGSGKADGASANYSSGVSFGFCV